MAKPYSSRPLAAREKEALQLRSRGKKHEEIARAMGISVARVDQLLAYARAKMGTTSTKVAIARAKDRGEIS